MTNDSGKKPREYTVFGGECNGFPTLLCDGPIPKINERILVREVTPCANCERLEAENKMMREVLEFYADVNSWIKYHPRPGWNNESDSACVLKDHSDKEFIMGEDKSGYTGKFYKESFNVGGKRAREFLASMEGKK